MRLYVLIAMVVLLAACAPDQIQEVPSLPNDQNRIYTIQDGNNDIVPDEPQPADEEPVAQDAQSELDALLMIEPPAAVTITYKNTATQDDKSYASTITYYLTAEESRTDVVAPNSPEIHQFLLEGVYYECGYLDDAWTCYRFPPPEGQEQPDDAEIPEAPGVVVTRLQGRIFAGIPSGCFEILVPRESVTQVLCVADGLVLYDKLDGPDGGYESKAVSLKKSVDENAFELPAEPQDPPEQE